MLSRDAFKASENWRIRTKCVKSDRLSQRQKRGEKTKMRQNCTHAGAGMRAGQNETGQRSAMGNQLWRLRRHALSLRFGHQLDRQMQLCGSGEAGAG